ncbi:HEAT repeat domain-containing protein [Candidatus Riflebacteria bacterium]
MIKFPDCPQLREALKTYIDEDNSFAHSAIEGLGAIAHQDDLIYLKNLTEHIFYHEPAFVALGFSKNKSLVPFLEKFLADTKNKNREYAAWCLGQIGDISAQQVLADSINDPVRMISYYASKALFELSNNKLDVKILKKLPIEDSDEWLAQSNIDIIFKTLGKDARNILIPVAKSIENPRILASIISCLSSCLPDEEVIQLLISSLKNPDSRVRANAIEALENKEMSDREKEKFFTPFFQDLDNRCCANAIFQLYPIMPRECEQKLKSMIHGMNSNWIRSAAFVLAKLGINKPELEYSQLLQHENPLVRRLSLKALVNNPQWITSERLIAALKDKDVWVRLEAIEILKTLENPPDLKSNLNEYFTNEKHSKILISLIEYWEDHTSSRKEEDIIFSSGKHTDPSVRCKAIEYFGKKGLHNRILSLKNHYARLDDDSAALYFSYQLEFDFANMVDKLVEQITKKSPLLKEFHFKGIKLFGRRCHKPQKTKLPAEEKGKIVIQEGQDVAAIDSQSNKKVAIHDYVPVSQKIVDSPPGEQNFLQEADFCFQAAQYKEAQYYYKKYLKQNPEDSSARYRLGVCFYKMERYRDCELELNRVLKNNNMYEAKIILGNLYLKAKKWDEVITLLGNVKDSEKNDIKRYLGLAYYNQGNFKKAGEHFRMILQTQPDSISAAYHLGICYYQERNYKRALMQFEHVNRIAAPGSRISQTVIDYIQKIEAVLEKDS